MFEIFNSPLRRLLHPAIVAYHQSQGVIYIADSYSETAVSGLARAGIPIEVVRITSENYGRNI